LHVGELQLALVELGQQGFLREVTSGGVNAALG
jgi:hypothetical protein